MRAFLSRDTRAEAEVGLGRLLPGVPPSELSLIHI